MLISMSEFNCCFIIYYDFMIYFRLVLEIGYVLIFRTYHL